MPNGLPILEIAGVSKTFQSGAGQIRALSGRLADD